MGSGSGVKTKQVEVGCGEWSVGRREGQGGKGGATSVGQWWCLGAVSSGPTQVLSLLDLLVQKYQD